MPQRQPHTFQVYSLHCLPIELASFAWKLNATGRSLLLNHALLYHLVRVTDGGQDVTHDLVVADRPRLTLGRPQARSHIRAVLEAWRADYNNERPHSRLGCLDESSHLRRSTAVRRAALHRRLRSADRRHNRPTGHHRRPDSNRRWIKTGGNVTANVASIQRLNRCNRETW
jgi:Integrase core domain